MRRGPDGRAKEHTALNVLLQCSGSLVMKKSCIILWEDVRAAALDAHKVLDMHDEGQSEVLKKHTELYCPIAVNSIIKAGEHFNLNIPLDAEAKVGINMAETH